MPQRDDLEEAAAGRSRLRVRLAVILCLAIMPAAILSVADALRRYNSIVRERDAAFVATAQQDARATRDTLLEVRATLRATAANPVVAAFDPDLCATHLREIVAASPIAQLAVAVDRTGAVRCASRPLPAETSFAEDLDFARFLQQPDFVITVRAPGRFTGAEALVASVPIEREGEVVGSLSLSISVAALRYFEAISASEGTAKRAIVDAEGAVLLDASRARAETWLPRDPTWPARFGREATVAMAESADGVRRVFGVSPFLSDRLWLVAASDTGALYDEAVLRVLPAIVAPVLMLVLAVGVSWFSVDRLVVRHLGYLARMARAYGRGRLDLKPRIDDTATAEIASLFASVGKMAEQLATRERDLRQSAETNRVLLLEVYHRVRNNLQMIASLLNLQMRRAETDGAQAALRQIRDRVHSLALVHEKLYEAEALDTLDLGALVSDVARAAVASGAAAEGPDATALTLEIGEAPLRVGPDLATPLALFTSEAVREAIRRGRASHGAPDICVTLAPRGDGGVLLGIETDCAPAPDAAQAGAAPQGCQMQGADRLGQRLMASFARQVRGEVHERCVGQRHRIELATPGAAARAAAPA